MVLSLLSTLLPAGLFFWFLTFASVFSNPYQSRDYSYTIQWLPRTGINLDFKVDSLGLFMALLITGIGTLVSLYANAYLKHDKMKNRFHFPFLLFMGAMLGIVLSNNLISLFVFWELTSISSYLLIGYKHENENSRISALQALLITGIGGLCLLVAFLMIGHQGQTYSFDDLLMSKEMIQNSKYYLPIVILLFLGAFTKSAQFPFHFWLPNAMAAPTPVSAYLHSATMVKAGVFLVAKFSPLLGGTSFWHHTLLIVGSVTTLWACWLSLGQRDLKKILAYTTLSSLGILTLLQGFEGSLATKAFMAFFLAHALYKASLFMLAGSIDHETGTRDIARLEGLKKSMPLSAMIAIIAGLSLAGIPPTWSFISKELILESILENLSSWHSFLALFTIIIFALTMVYLTTLILWAPFFGKRLNVDSQESAPAQHEAPWPMILAPAVLALAGFYFVIFNSSVSLWHGFTIPLLISILTIGCGIGIFFFRKSLWTFASSHQNDRRFSIENFYYKIVETLPKFSKNVFDRIQNGNLRYYIATTLSFSLIFILWPLHKGLLIQIPNHLWQKVHFEEILINLALIFGVIATLLSRKTFVALASSGVIGLAVAFYYVFYGAPDLAMTQVLVEALSLILVVLVLFSFSRVDIPLSKSSQFFTLGLSISMGICMSLVTVASLTNNYFDSISRYFSENSAVLAHGKNVVNVILVDFRGWDTMGEITVLGISSMGVYALLRWRNNSSVTTTEKS